MLKRECKKSRWYHENTVVYHKLNIPTMLKATLRQQNICLLHLNTYLDTYYIIHTMYVYCIRKGILRPSQGNFWPKRTGRII